MKASYIKQLTNKLPLIAYISSGRIGHQAWETMLHCAYANKTGRKLVIIYSNNVVNKSFNALKGKNVIFLNLSKALYLINNKPFNLILRKLLKFIIVKFKYLVELIHSSKHNKNLHPEIKPQPQAQLGNNSRFGTDMFGVFLDFIIGMFPFIRSRPFLGYNKDYFNYPLLINNFQPLYINDKLTKKGEGLLTSLGIPSSGWFVCLHVRESSSHKDSYKEWQNQEAKNYFKAIKYITDKGGYVIKMGDSSMRKMPEMKNFIDYPHTKHKSDFGDLYISSKANFCIVNNSGYRTLPQLFHIPLLTVNMYPITPMDIYDKVLIIFKKVYLENCGSNLKLKAIINDPTLCHRHTDIEYQEAGLKIAENTEDEILEAVKEMFELLNNNSNSSLTKHQMFFQRRLKEALENSAHTYNYGNTMFYPYGICNIGSNYFLKNW